MAYSISHTENAWKAKGPHIMQELKLNGIKWYIIWFVQPHFQKLITECQYLSVLHDLVCQKKTALSATALRISNGWSFRFSISIQCAASGNIWKGQAATPSFNLGRFHKPHWASFLCLPTCLETLLEINGNFVKSKKLRVKIKRRHWNVSLRLLSPMFLQIRVFEQCDYWAFRTAHSLWCKRVLPRAL